MKELLYGSLWYENNLRWGGTNKRSHLTVTPLATYHASRSARRGPSGAGKPHDLSAGPDWLSDSRSPRRSLSQLDQLSPILSPSAPETNRRDLINHLNTIKLTILEINLFVVNPFFYLIHCYGFVEKRTVQALNQGSQIQSILESTNVEEGICIWTRQVWI